MIKLPWRNVGGWHVVRREIQHCILLEVTDHPGGRVRRLRRTLYIDLILGVLNAYRVAAISQFVDTRQWRDYIGDKEQYVGALGRRFSVATALTATYETADPPRPESDEFVIHVTGSINRPLLEEALAFGMTPLPNVVYALNDAPEPWPNQVLEWNRSLVEWFYMQDPESTLEGLLEQVRLLSWTADGHLWLASSCADRVNAVLQSINEVSRRWGLKPTIESAADR
jgi:hypothetical protein